MNIDLSRYKVDLTLLPTTFDAVHAGLAGLALLLFMILTLLLLGKLLRRSKPKTPLAEASQGPVIDTKVVEKVIEKPVPAMAPEPVILKEYTPDAALQLLGLLQKEARFIDFLQEDVTSFSDADVGAAVRVVHEGCAKVIKQHFQLEPVRKEQENSSISLPKGFDASSVRLTGNIVGEAPFSGTLIHRGWQVTDIKLPKITRGHNIKVVAAAEVEL
ncbi:MAG: DUF2760 domain-containing protein [Methylococcaceae bacterium]